MRFNKAVELGLGVFAMAIIVFTFMPSSSRIEEDIGESSAVAFSNEQISEVSFFKSEKTTKTHFSFTTEAISYQDEVQIVSVQQIDVDTGLPGEQTCSTLPEDCTPPPPVLSVANTGGGNPTSVCSAFGTVPNGPTAPACSVENNPGSPDPNAGPGTCSTGMGPVQSPSPCSTIPAQVPALDLSECSVQHVPGGNQDNHCSTKVNASNGGYCSAYVDPTRVPVGGNRECSVRNGATGGNPAQQECSVAANVSTITCSTTGGASGGAPGNPSCSAGRPGAPNNGRCSVVKVNHQATCSTNKGEHQNCSTGAVGTGATQRCSAFSQANAEPQFCSVKQQPPAGGTYNNKCSALNNNAPGATHSMCSVQDHTAATTQVCSVLKGQTTGGRCTVINDTGLPNPGARCSTFTAMPGGTAVGGQASRCSVVDMGPPIVITRPGNICGTGVGHFDDTDGDGWPDTRDNFPYDPNRH